MNQVRYTDVSRLRHALILLTDFERDVGDMMFYLKDEVMRKLDNERWLYEPVDRLQPPLA